MCIYVNEFMDEVAGGNFLSHDVSNFSKSGILWAFDLLLKSNFT